MVIELLSRRLGALQLAFEQLNARLQAEGSSSRRQARAPRFHGRWRRDLAQRAATDILRVIAGASAICTS
jgi:hypothetical protein